MIGGSESARLRDLRLLLRLKDRPVRARNRNCVLPKRWAGQSENKRNRTPAAELDFGSEANHAISNYQTVFAAVPTVKQNQPPMPTLSASNHRLNEMISSRFNALTNDQALATCGSELRELDSIIAEHREEFIVAWDEHFGQ
jgi:hypothetical protein